MALIRSSGPACGGVLRIAVHRTPVRVDGWVGRWYSISTYKHLPHARFDQAIA